MSKYVCSICGYIHDEELGYPEGDISPKTPWSDIPSSFICPLCGASKEEFFEQVDSTEDTITSFDSEIPIEFPEEIDYTARELSAIFSNLSKGSEKQYDLELSKLYGQLSSYYEKPPKSRTKHDFEDIKTLLQEDLSSSYTMGNEVASKYKDRGALRALKWSEAVTRMTNSHLKKLSLGSADFLEKSNLYVCEICGFIHIGAEKPNVCPVCKVPNIKMTQIKRGA